MLPWTCSRRIRHLQKQNRSVSTQPQNTPFLTRVQSGSLPGNYVPSFWQLLTRSRGPAQDHFASSLHHHRDHAAAFRYFKNIAPIIAIKIISWTSLNYSKPIFTHTHFKSPRVAIRPNLPSNVCLFGLELSSATNNDLFCTWL